MAEKQDLDFTYTTIDEIFRLSIGQTGDFSGAKYDGNFSMSLEEAQRAKHDFMADSLHIKKGDRVLDLGCGWGPFCKYATEIRQAECIGLTLSQGQAKACQRQGLNVFVKDCRTVKPQDFGVFNAVVSVGAFEHFCSIEEWQRGEQEIIYDNFFKSVYDLLPKGSRFYLQTMTFGKNMIPFEEINIDAPKNSPSYIMALMIKEFPNSWLPDSADMVIRNAEPYFQLISKSSGRLDYIETISQWRKRFRQFNLKKYWLYLSLIPRYFRDPQFRHHLEIFRISPNRVCFEQELMDHYRLVFEKK